MLAAFAFLTPFGPVRTPGPCTLRWFPIVGASIGAIVGVIWWGASKAWTGSLLPATLAVAADMAMTGLLHFDGVADSADGLLPHLERARRLEVMSEPTVGAFGVVVTAGVLLLRVAALSSLRPDIALVAGEWCVSRSVVVAASVTMPYARPAGGLASAFLGDRRSMLLSVSVSGVVAGAALATWGRGWPALPSVAIGIVSAIALLALARRRLGGFTGDVLGAGVVLSETAALLVAAARW